MQNRHFKVWPPGRPHHLEPLETSVYQNLEVTAQRSPQTPAIIYYDTVITYAELLADVRRLAGYLAGHAGIKTDDRAVLYLQNSPQFVIGYYAILAANAVVVPVNPMNRTEELRHIADDAGARLIIAGQDVAEQAEPLVGNSAVGQLIRVRYCDYVREATELELPAVVTEPHRRPSGAIATAWADAMATGSQPPAHTRRPDDWCTIPYSSGTTGAPKGCLHTHRSTNAIVRAYASWVGALAGSRVLGTLPLFHVTGMQNSMHAPIFAGASVVLMTRWHRDTAARLIERYRIAHWRSITTMAIDFVSHPEIGRYDLSSMATLGGGGAQMPAAVAARLKALTGLDYVEAYGLTETMAPTHINPPQAAKPQC
ncbi:MAG: AMP-binding protein, partial [Aestuariivirgaceae bacterium]